jgi:spore maturation protein SpmA
MYRYGGVLWRQTADAGMPTDTPPAGIIFYNLTAGGLYLWDGTAYRAIGAQPLNPNKDTIPAGEVDVIPVNTQVMEFGPTTVYGTLTVYGRFRTTY